MNSQKNIEIDGENDVDEYVNLLLYPIKDTITQFLNKKMSIKQMRGKAKCLQTSRKN